MASMRLSPKSCFLVLPQDGKNMNSIYQNIDLKLKMSRSILIDCVRANIARDLTTTSRIIPA